MSGSCKSKPRCFGNDIHRLLQAAEAGQKADILTYSSGHLGPHSLNQNQPHRDKKMSLWRMSQSQEETPNPLTLQWTKAVTNVKQREIKESLAEFSTGAASKEPKDLRSRQDQDRSSQRREVISLPKIVHCPSDSLPVQPRVFSQKQSNSLSDTEGKQQFCSSQSEQSLNVEHKLKMKQRFGRKVKQDLWAGINVAEMHERKLQKGLKKLSAQSWPSRDRLAVFSDVFDDVCESSPVFGRILREIKTDYDLYVNHMMSSQLSLLSMSHNTSVADLSNVKVKEKELEDAEKEVCMLEEEVRRALEENKRLRNELQNVPDIIGPEENDFKNTSVVIDGARSVQSKRLQVLNTWREIQQLEEEIELELVSTATTTATERRIKDVKTDIMRLIASNDRLKTTSKNMENNINMVLNREKASKALRRMLWDEIHGDLQTECEQLHEQVNQRVTL